MMELFIWFKSQIAMTCLIGIHGPKTSFTMNALTDNGGLLKSAGTQSSKVGLSRVNHDVWSP